LRTSSSWAAVCIEQQSASITLRTAGRIESSSGKVNLIRLIL
jgi:hypothetical protein